jgi:hypothetical protein
MKLIQVAKLYRTTFAEEIAEGGQLVKVNSAVAAFFGTSYKFQRQHMDVETRSASIRKTNNELLEKIQIIYKQKMIFHTFLPFRVENFAYWRSEKKSTYAVVE